MIAILQIICVVISAGVGCVTCWLNSRTFYHNKDHDRYNELHDLYNDMIQEYQMTREDRDRLLSKIKELQDTLDKERSDYNGKSN